MSNGNESVCGKHSIIGCGQDKQERHTAREGQRTRTERRQVGLGRLDQGGRQKRGEKQGESSGKLMSILCMLIEESL